MSEWPAFLDTKAGMRGATAESAANRCASVSHEFLQFLRRIGHPEDPTSGALIGVTMHIFEGHPLTPTGHIAVLIDGMVVDWTARQLDPSLAHPHIEPFDSYCTRFTSNEDYLHRVLG